MWPSVTEQFNIGAAARSHAAGKLYDTMHSRCNMIHSARFHIIFFVIEWGYKFTKFPVNALGESAADAKISLSVVCRVCSSLHLQPQEGAALRPAEALQPLFEQRGREKKSAWPFHNCSEVCYNNLTVR